MQLTSNAVCRLTATFFGSARLLAERIIRVLHNVDFIIEAR
jgi:hypothetical protein